MNLVVLYYLIGTSIHSSGIPNDQDLDVTIAIVIG